MPTMRRERNLALSRVSYERYSTMMRADYTGTKGKGIAEVSTFLNSIGMEWRDRAACRGSDLNFVPSKFDGPGGETANVRACKQVCASCPVTKECLQMAIDADDRLAICGGLTPKERKQLQEVAV